MEEDGVHNLLKNLSGLSVSSTMHDMEEDDEGIVERENKGKQNMLIGKDEELSKWANIPSDILEMIMKRLKLTDYLGTSAVCSSWKATFTEVIANKPIKPLPELPLLVLQWNNRLTPRSSFLRIKSEEICSVINKNTMLPESNHICHGAIEGWMILSINLFVGTSKIIFFLNPVTSDVVIVPSPLKFPSNSPISSRPDLYMGRMVASSSPKCEDCVLLCLFTDYTHIAYFRVNHDKSWTMIEAKKGDNAWNFLNVEIFNGKLYVITMINMSSTSMLVYDLQDSTDNSPKPIVLGELPPVRPIPDLRRHENYIHVKGSVIRFLTTGYAAEELLLIYLFQNYVYVTRNVGYTSVIKEYASSPRITKCEVFKLDARSNEWVKLDHLGDRVIFVGHDKCFVMSRTLLNCSEELIAENSVYFALYFPCSRPWLNIQLGRLCLTENKIKYFSFEEFGFELDAYPCWFIPSAW